MATYTRIEIPRPRGLQPLNLWRVADEAGTVLGYIERTSRPGQQIPRGRADNRTGGKTIWAVYNQAQVDRMAQGFEVPLDVDQVRSVHTAKTFRSLADAKESLEFPPQTESMKPTDFNKLVEAPSNKPNRGPNPDDWDRTVHTWGKGLPQGFTPDGKGYVPVEVIPDWSPNLAVLAKGGKPVVFSSYEKACKAIEKCNERWGVYGYTDQPDDGQPISSAINSGKYVVAWTQDPDHRSDGPGQPWKPEEPRRSSRWDDPYPPGLDLGPPNPPSNWNNPP